MSTNINGGVQLGGLLTIEHLQGKNPNKPVKGQKLPGFKEAAKLRKKSPGDNSATREVKLMGMVKEDHPMDQESVKAETRVQVASVDTTTKTATRDDLYAILTKEDVPDNAAYEVDGVRFSAEEMKSMREALGDVFTSVKQPGSGLVYSDYAKMGIAENVIRSYAEKNLSGEQAEVIMKAVSEHIDQVIDREPEADFVVEDRYYGKRYSGGVWAELKQYAKDMVANSDLPEQTKRVFAESRVDSPGIAMSASNTKLANSIRSGFSTLDFGNEEEVRSFFKQYEDWMKPAYMEVQDGRAEAAVETIAYDIALYKRQYKDLTAHVLVASVPHINMQI